MKPLEVIIALVCAMALLSLFGTVLQRWWRNRSLLAAARALAVPPARRPVLVRHLRPGDDDARAVAHETNDHFVDVSTSTTAPEATSVDWSRAVRALMSLVTQLDSAVFDRKLGLELKPYVFLLPDLPADVKNDVGFSEELSSALSWLFYCRVFSVGRLPEIEALMRVLDLVYSARHRPGGVPTPGTADADAAFRLDLGLIRGFLSDGHADPKACLILDRWLQNGPARESLPFRWIWFASKLKLLLRGPQDTVAVHARWFEAPRSRWMDPLRPLDRTVTLLSALLGTVGERVAATALWLTNRSRPHGQMHRPTRASGWLFREMRKSDLAGLLIDRALAEGPFLESVTMRILSATFPVASTGHLTPKQRRRSGQSSFTPREAVAHPAS